MYLIHRAMTPLSCSPSSFSFPLGTSSFRAHQQMTRQHWATCTSSPDMRTAIERTFLITLFFWLFFFKSRCGKTRTTNPCGSLQYEWWCQCDMQPHSYGHTVKHWEWLVEMLLEWGLLLLVLLLGNYRFTAVITVRVSKVKRKRSDTCVWKSFTSVWPGEICEKKHELWTKDY